MLLKFKRIFFRDIWLFFLYRQYRISPIKIVNQLHESQYWNREKMEDFQLGNVKNLIHTAKSNVPFYSGKYKNLNYSDIDSLEKLGKVLPYITKEEIQSNNLLTTKIGKIDYRATTSGSTGDPLIVYLNDLAMAYRIAGRYRFYSWWGIYPEDKGVLIWGEKTKISNQKNFLKTLYGKTIKRKTRINIFTLNSETIQYYFNFIVKYKPVYLYGYTSAIKQFAELIIANNLRGELLNLKIAIVTSEVLFEDDREFIKSALKCEVVNEYGAADGGLYAFECPHGGMHIFEESVYLNTDEQGTVFSTEFHNTRMPLIQYKIGDRIEFDETQCECGRTLKKIKKIEGRLGDVIICANGESLSQYFFYYLMKNLDSLGYSNGIKKYKVVQKKGLLFDFYVVKGTEYKDEIEQIILTSMYDKIGLGIKVNFIPVDELPLEKSGKLRFFRREH